MAKRLKNATYIDWQTLELTTGDILVGNGENGKIKFINSDEMPGKIDSNIDCSGKLVTKSFVNGHHHVYSTLARGMPAPDKAPQNFHEILKYIWWNLDKALDLEMIEASALFTAMECAKNGVTFVIDHHASPNAIKGSLETIAKAFDKVGVSHLLCYEISDRDGEKTARKGLEESEDYLSKHHGLLGLHASFTLGEQTMKRTADLAAKLNTGIHIHVAEDRVDQEDAIRKYGYRVINRLHHYGFLEMHKTILAHCIHINDEERELLKQSEAWIAQNAESNLNNGVGFFSSAGLGENIMLGTDGMHSDMLRCANATYFNGLRIEKLTPGKIYQRLRNVHNYLYSNGFSGDNGNNLVILDYTSPTELTSNNFLGHFIYGIESKYIQHVISNGKLIIKDRQMTNVNEEDILTFSKEMGKKLWKKM